MILRNNILLLLSGLIYVSCINTNKILAELANMPAPDYTYILQPEFTADKESVEFLIKELYSADEVKIGGVGIHGYDEDTKAQKDEKYWLKVILLNSKAIVDFKNELKMNDLGKDVAFNTLKYITNESEYDKIEVTFIVHWNDGNQKWLKQNIFYTLPDLKVIKLFDGPRQLLLKRSSTHIYQPK